MTTIIGGSPKQTTRNKTAVPGSRGSRNSECPCCPWCLIGGGRPAPATGNRTPQGQAATARLAVLAWTDGSFAVLLLMLREVYEKFIFHVKKKKMASKYVFQEITT